MSEPTPSPLPAPPTSGAPCAWWQVEPEGLSETARKRRDEIMDAAEAIIGEQGIDELSLSKIEDRAGSMSRGQLTYYFPTRESILLAVHDRMLRRMIRGLMASDVPQPMTGRAWDCFRFALEDHLQLRGPPRGKELFTLLFTFLARLNQRTEYRDKLLEIYRGWREHIAADIAESVPEPRSVKPKIAASMIQAMIQGLDIQLMIDPEAFDRNEMFEACSQLFAPVFKQTE